MVRPAAAPTPDRTARLRVRNVLLVFAGWTVYGFALAYIIRVFLSPTVQPRPSFFRLLLFALSEAWLWALLTAPTVWLARRFPVTRQSWPARIPIHLGLAVLVHLLRSGGTLLLQPLVRPGYRVDPWGVLLNGILFDGFIYVAVVAIVHAMDAQTQTLRLHNQLLEAELRVLRMQLQPHFLFNTLNAVSELLHQNPASAERALTRLGDLLRWTLQSSTQAEVPLREELGALETYLEIQRIRHGDDLRFRVDADPDTLELGVPALLLQPLVENAIRHGIAGSEGLVVIEARRNGDRLQLRIRDDGRGFPSGHREGTGLATTRARLAGLYPGGQSLRIGAAPSGGGEVEMTLPAHAPNTGLDGARSRTA